MPMIEHVEASDDETAELDFSDTDSEYSDLDGEVTITETGIRRVLQQPGRLPLKLQPPIIGRQVAIYCTGPQWRRETCRGEQGKTTISRRASAASSKRWLAVLESSRQLVANDPADSPAGEKPQVRSPRLHRAAA